MTADVTGLRKDTINVAPDGVVNGSSSRLASFRIEPSLAQLIHPQTVSLQFTVSSDALMANSAASLVSSVTVLDGQGTTVSSTTQFARQHSLASDLTLTKEGAELCWNQLMDGATRRPSGDNAAPVLGSNVRVSLPLTFGLFSCTKAISPNDFGGLRVRVQFASASDALHSPVVVLSYTLSDVQLSYEASDISRSPMMLKAYQSGKRQYHYLNTEVYTSQTTQGQRVIRCAAPTQAKSVKRASMALFGKTVAGSVSVPERRFGGAAVNAIGSRFGTDLIPSQSVRGVHAIWDMTSTAVGGSLGFLTRQNYSVDGDRWLAIIPYQQFTGGLNGMDMSGGPQLELFAEVEPTVPTSTMQVVLTVDALYDSGTRMVVQ